MLEMERIGYSETHIVDIHDETREARYPWRYGLEARVESDLPSQGRGCKWPTRATKSGLGCSTEQAGQNCGEKREGAHV